jgi:hypothetical protein
MQHIFKINVYIIIVFNYYAIYNSSGIVIGIVIDIVIKYVQYLF